MADNVAVVVGAGGAIGAACARELAVGRDMVACVDVAAERAERTAQAVQDIGARGVSIIRVDSSAAGPGMLKTMTLPFSSTDSAASSSD